MGRPSRVLSSGSSLHLDQAAPLADLVARLNGYRPQMLSACATIAGLLTEGGWGTAAYRPGLGGH